MSIFARENIKQFLELNPIEQVFYLGYLINCWTSVPRFYIAIKLARLFHWLGLHSVSNWIGHVSGLTKRLVQQYPDLADDEMRAKYLD